MEKKFKHKKTGEIITYKDGVIKSGTFVLDMGCEPSSEYWEEIGEPKEEYSLYYNNLKNGEYYTTEYPNQGLYTFKQGYNLWVAHNHNIIRKTESNLTPQNGFHNFRKATKEEIQMLEPKKDYEILSLRYNNHDIRPFQDVIVDYKNDKPVRRSDNKSVHNTVEISKFTKKDWEKYITILSVSRLSDDFVITLGDYCKTKKGSSGKVTTIEFCDNGELRIGSDRRYYVGINDVVKSEVLFRTEDNVEIREGDKYCCIYKNNFEPFEDLKMFTANNGVVLKDQFLFFSTKEAAENFIICNKPCLSFNDIWNISDNKSSDNNYVVVSKKELKQLVKSKL